MNTPTDQFDLARFIRDVPDFPEPGIIFRDVTPLLAVPAAFERAVAGLAEVGTDVDLVLGIESRGFILGAPVALKTGAGFVPARKAGKLPGETVSVHFELEYGEAVLELQAGAVAPGQRVLIVDDVLATGGTAAAAAALVEQLGGVVAGLSFLIELSALHGAEQLGAYTHRSLLSY